MANRLSWLERFWAKVARTEACWLWLGAQDLQGYGRLGARLAHRVSYELFSGPIPEGLEIDHLCRVRSCVNPAHLEPVTHQENMSRSSLIGAHNRDKTHCKRGHEFTPESTRLHLDGARACRICERERVLARKAADPETFRVRARAGSQRYRAKQKAAA